MNIRVLGAGGGDRAGHRLPAFFVNDHLLLDAGGAAAALPLEAQEQVEHVLLSHAHLDHTVGLAFLADNRALSRPVRPLTALAIEPVIATLRTHCFNDVLWPDFSQLPTPEHAALVFRALGADAQSGVGPYAVTPVPVHHTVPAAGFLLHDGEAALAYTGDTGPTVAFWRAATKLPGLKAVIAECSFPNRMEALALATGHLTPALLWRELERIPSRVQVHIFHIKPAVYSEVLEELSELDRPVRVLQEGDVLTL